MTNKKQVCKHCSDLFSKIAYSIAPLHGRNEANGRKWRHLSHGHRGKRDKGVLEKYSPSIRAASKRGGKFADRANEMLTF